MPSSILRPRGACRRCRRSGPGPRSVSTTVSMVSRVVPGMSWTTDRSSPMSRLNSVDLPTLGRPTMATDEDLRPARRRRPSSARRPSALGGQARSTQLVEQVAGAAAVQRADRDGLAEAEAPGSPRRRPPGWRRRPCWPRRSTGMSRPPQQRRRPGVVLVVTPTVDVDDEEHGVGVVDGPLALAADLRRRGRSSVASQPPVSTTMNGRPLHSASTALRSRVTPGCSSTMASRRPDDAVEQGRLADVGPADDGDDRAGSCRQPARARPAGTGRRWRRPRPGGAGRRAWCRRGSGPGQADVGQQVAVARGLVGQDPGEVLPHHQAGDADVAAEEPVLDRRRPARRRGRPARAAPGPRRRRSR